MPALVSRLLSSPRSVRRLALVALEKEEARTTGSRNQETIQVVRKTTFPRSCLENTPKIPSTFPWRADPLGSGDMFQALGTPSPPPFAS